MSRLVPILIPANDRFYDELMEKYPQKLELPDKPARFLFMYARQFFDELVKRGVTINCDGYINYRDIARFCKADSSNPRDNRRYVYCKGFVFTVLEYSGTEFDYKRISSDKLFLGTLEDMYDFQVRTEKRK